MWILQKKAITSLFFCEQDFCQRLHAFQSQYQWLSLERRQKNILCQTVVKKKNSFSSIIEGNLIYFFKDFLVADCFRLNMLTFRCAKLKRKLYFFEVMKHLLFWCSRVSVCVWYFSCVSFFATMDLSEK